MPSLLIRIPSIDCNLTLDPRAVPAAVQIHLPWQFCPSAAGHVRAKGRVWRRARGFGACGIAVLLNSPASGLAASMRIHDLLQYSGYAALGCHMRITIEPDDERTSDIRIFATGHYHGVVVIKTVVHLELEL